MTGYGAMAARIARHHDIESFRKFSALNVENILHMQAELQHLEMVINEVRKVPELSTFDRVWIECPEDLSTEDVRGMFERSRVLLDQYHRALLRTARMDALQKPREDVLQLRRRWYDEESGGNGFLYGAEAGIFCDTSIEDDLMILKENVGSKDPLARFLMEKVLPLYHRLVGFRLHRSMAEKAFDNTWEYKPELMVQVGNTICMLLSAVIPALSIMVLFSVKSMEARLVAISVMSLVFSMVMNVIAQRRADVFMSTTAFAAVLVVFVGSSNGID